MTDVHRYVIGGGDVAQRQREEPLISQHTLVLGYLARAARRVQINRRHTPDNALVRTTVAEELRNGHQRKTVPGGKCR